MPRITMDIGAPILREIKALQKKEGRSVGKIVSQLLAEAIARRKVLSRAPSFKWVARPMRALVDIADKEALSAALHKDKV